MKRSFVFFFTVIFSAVLSAQPRIAWFSTLHPDLSEKSGFWSRVHDLVVAAGEDLDVGIWIFIMPRKTLSKCRRKWMRFCPTR